MITRIVKLTLAPGKSEAFKILFNESKSLIRNFEGCTHVELYQDIQRPDVFFTYSYWDSEAHLLTYRESDLFKNIWSKTKILFADKAEAWSLQPCS